MLDFPLNGYPLSDLHMEEVQDLLGIEAPKLWAVMEIEARSCGYLADRHPIILFERHKFHQFTAGIHRHSSPDLSDSKAGGYGRGGLHQYEKLSKAAVLDRDAAFKSCSWGLGQVMGYHFGLVGYPTVDAFVKAMFHSEAAQLQAMAMYIVKTGADKLLAEGDWTSFARSYNGPNYAINQYDVRLNGSFEKYKIGPLPDLTVRAAQIALTYLGYSPGPVDGWCGRQTMMALNEWRHSRGQTETERLSAEDVEALQVAFL